MGSRVRTVDVRNLLDGRRKDRMGTIDDLRKSFAESGFVYLLHSDLTMTAEEKEEEQCGDDGGDGSGGISSRLLRDARQFFLSATAAQKSAVRTVEGGQKRGYYRFESTGNTDVECFNVGKQVDRPEELRRRYFESICAPNSLWLDVAQRHNIWPEGFSSLRNSCLEYFTRAQKITMAIVEAIDIDPTLHSLEDSELELKFYPSIKTKDDYLRPPRFDPHVDLTTLTLLVQDQVSGLEMFLPSSSTWLPVDKTEKLVLCNLGAFGAQWNGALRAGKHRVLARQGPDRTSAVFFCTPNWHVQLPDGSAVGDHMPIEG